MNLKNNRLYEFSEIFNHKSKLISCQGEQTVQEQQEHQDSV